MNTLTKDVGRIQAIWILLALVLLGAFLRLYLFYGYTGLDDGEYARLAYLMARGEYPLGTYAGPAVFPWRVGIIAPTALVFRIFGPSEWGAAVVPLALSLLALPLAYVFGALTFGRGAGLLAAGLLAILPIDVQGATSLVPDLPAAVLAAAGVTVIVVATRWRDTGPLILGVTGAGAGILFGASWLCKESLAYYGPFLLLLVGLTLRRDGTRVLPLWVGVAVGGLGTLFAEIAVYSALTGDPLFRFHEVERNYAQWENGFFSEGSDWGWQPGESRAAAVVRRLFITGPRFLFWNEALSYLPLAGLIAVGYGAAKKDGRFLVPALWLLTLLFMFNFSSSSTSTYTPLALFNRYLFPLFLPAAVLVGGFLALQIPPVLEALRRPRALLAAWPGLTVVALLLLGAVRPLIWSLRDPDRSWTAEVRALAATIGPETPLYADTLSLRGLDFFQRYPEQVQWVDFQRVASSEVLEPGSLVLLNPRYLQWLERNRGMWLSERDGYRTHSFFETPDPQWTRVWENGNAALYRVEGPRP